MCTKVRVPRVFGHFAAVLLVCVIAWPDASMADHGGPCSDGADIQTQIDELLPEGSFVGLSDQPDGAEALLFMPPPVVWNLNPSVIFFARGDTLFDDPELFDDPDGCKLASVVGQLDLGETSLPALANELGFGFAISSCSEDFLALEQCKQAMIDLAKNLDGYIEEVEQHNAGLNPHAYADFTGLSLLTGVSLGSLVATQLIEEQAELMLASTQASHLASTHVSYDEFDGGLAACGPIGDFERMIRYQGDVLVLTDCLYEDALAALGFPDGLVTREKGFKDPQVPENVAMALADGSLCPALEAMIDANPKAAERLLRIMAVSTEPVATDPSEETVGETLADILCSDTLPAIQVSDARFGGNPYDNKDRIYFDPARPFGTRELNRCVERFKADATIEDFETSGKLADPLVTLHTLRDPRVPFSQNVLYTAKVFFGGSLAQYAALPSDNFGHCAFDVEEVLAALGVLIFRVSGFDLLGVEWALDQPEPLERYYELLEEHRGR